MPIFKVVTRDFTRKILIICDNLKDLINSSVQRLGLPHVEYTVVLQEDETEIHDDDVLLSLSDNTPTPVTVMLIEKQILCDKNKLLANNLAGLNNLENEMLLTVLDQKSLDQSDVRIIPFTSEEHDSNSILITSDSQSKDVSQIVEKEKEKDISIQDIMKGKMLLSSPAVSTSIASTSGETSDTQCISNQSLSINKHIDFCETEPIPWYKFPKQLIEACENGKIPLPVHRRAMISILAEYQVAQLKTESRSTSRKIAQRIIRKYPQSFLDQIDGTILGDGAESLFCQLYTKIHYNRRTKLMAVKTQKSADSFSSLIKEKEKFQTSKTDEYGCAAYEPSLPFHETMDTQRMKKNWLKEQASKSQRDITRIKMLLQETYPLQRMEFNYRKGTIYSCLESWPFLKEAKYLIQHASMLLGKDVNIVWIQNVEKTYKKLRVFIEEFTIEHKLKKSINRKMQLQVLKNVLTDSAIAAQDLASETPLILAIFPLILHYFQENPDMMFTVIHGTLTEEKLNSFADILTPLLIIEGASLFDENASCAIIAEGKICCTTKSILQGFQLTFLMYYIFSLCYCNDISKTLEFIQRIFFNINPTTGSKKSQNLRKKTSYDPAVKKLFDSIQKVQL